MSSLLPEVLLGVDEVFVHDEVDVGVVRVKELLDLPGLGVVEEQPQVLKERFGEHMTMIISL